MNTPMNRRNFLKASSGAALATAVFSPNELIGAETSESTPAKKSSLKKAIMYATTGGFKGSVLEKFKAIKEAGFEGVEPMSHMDQDEVMKARDEVGLVIPSVCGRDHWSKPLSHPDPKVREEGLEAPKHTLRHAQ